MAKSLPEPNSTWNPEDIPGWRREQFSALGFKGDLLDFLADSKMDVHAVRGLIGRGCDPMFAIRIEAGHDHAGQDESFDHVAFDRIMLTDVVVDDFTPEDWFEFPDEPERKTVSGIL